MSNVIRRICDAGTGFHEDYIRVHVEAGVKGTIGADCHGSSGIP